MVVGGELTEQRVGVVDEQSRGVRRTHLEPAGVPEHGQELLPYVGAVAHLAGSTNQHVAPTVEDTERLVIQRGSDIDIALIDGFFRRIEPHVPVVDEVRAAHQHLQTVLRGLLDVGHRQADVAKGDGAADGDVLDEVPHLHLHAIFGAEIDDDVRPLQRLLTKMGNLYLCRQRIACGIDKPRQTGQRDGLAAETMPLVGMDVLFFVEEDVRDAHQCRALSAVVVERQQFESCVARRAQRLLNLILVAECLQLAAGHHEVVSQLGHVVLGKNVAEDVEVLGLVDTCVFASFVEIGEDAPLSRLMADVGCRAGLLDEAVVAEVVHAVGLLACPLQSAGASLHVVLALGLPLPAATHRSARIDATRVVFLPVIHELAHPFHPVAARLVADGHHAERRMVTVGLDHALGFGP